MQESCGTRRDSRRSTVASSPYEAITSDETWVRRQTKTPEARRLYEEERLILWATEAIAELMEKQGRTRADVAKALGTSRPNVTQLLSGSRNMTLRTLAALAHACGMRAEVKLEPLSRRGREADKTPLEQVREIARPHRREPGSVVDSFIAERRAEAARE